MKKLTNTLNNQQGFVLVASLMMLMILLVIGIAATNTTTIELQISGNDKLAKQTFYQAEGVVAEAVRVIINDVESNSAANLEGSTPFGWLYLDPAGDGILTTGAGGTELTDVYSDAFWGMNGGDSSLPVVGSQVLEMLGAFRGIAPGGSLDLGSSRLHDYDIYGRSRQNNSLAIIKEGLRIPF